jgi:hypothetical protein
MARVRRVVLLALLTAGLAACGGSAPSGQVDFSEARAHTVGEGTARFTLSISATVAGARILASETGTVSFTKPRAHVYKLGSNIVVPQELIVVGPFAYTNGNVDEAMRDSNVKPWTKLDTRRLSARQRRHHLDELSHVRAIAYLPVGVARAKRIGSETVDEAKTTHFRGTVDPERLIARAPAAIGAAVRRDYAGSPFTADFWLDRAGRLRHVRVDYRTPKGGRIIVDGGYRDFGVAVDVSLPPASSIQDISP